MKTTAEMIEVMAAHMRGEKIESNSHFSTSGWGALDDPCWNWMRRDYRVAPKPVECWAWLYESGRLGPVYDSRQEAESYSSINGGHAILMREVIE